MSWDSMYVDDVQPSCQGGRDILMAHSNESIHPPPPAICSDQSLISEFNLCSAC